MVQATPLQLYLFLLHASDEGTYEEFAASYEAFAPEAVVSPALFQALRQCDLKLLLLEAGSDLDPVQFAQEIADAANAGYKIVTWQGQDWFETLVAGYRPDQLEILPCAPS